MRRHIPHIPFFINSYIKSHFKFFSTKIFLSKHNKNYIYRKIRHIFNSLNDHEQEKFVLPNDGIEGIFIESQVNNNEIFKKKFFLYHFGNGDEKEKEIIKEYINQLGLDHKLYVFPGMGYGHIEIITENNSIIDNKSIYKCTIKSNREDEEENKGNKIFILIKDGKYKYYLVETSKKIDEVMLFIKRNIKSIKYMNIDNINYSHIVEGLYIIEEFISEEEEKNLIQVYDRIENIPENDIIINTIEDNFSTYMNCRGIVLYKDLIAKTFNERINFLTKRLFFDKKTVTTDLDADADVVVERNFYSLEFDLPSTHNKNKDNKESYFKLRNNTSFNQIYINKYPPGKGKNNKSPFCIKLINDVYMIVNIGSSMVISLNEYNSDGKKGNQVDMFIKQRSIIIFTNDSRFKWYYSIASRKYDLVNEKLLKRKDLLTITFIYSNNTQPLSSLIKYENIYNKLYSSQSSLSQKVKCLKSIEQTYVYNVYDKIAYHFSSTRYKPWPRIVKFINDLKDYSLIGDFGCGNGKYLSITNNKYIIGCDISQKLLEIAKERNKRLNLIRSSTLLLPMRDNVYDAVISIAVIHHFSNIEFRKKSIEEMKRLVKKGGLILIYVWAYEQESRSFSQQENLVPWYYQRRFDKERVNIEDNQIDKIEICYRYYYVFKENELEKLVVSVGGLEVIESFYDKENWCCIAKKT